MYNENDFIQISAIQHLLFCPRQCALIHIEGQWGENHLTAEGRVMHERVHEEGVDRRKGLTVERDLPVRSLVLGLTGKADVVEFHHTSDGLMVFPVEYKRGKPKPDDCDKVQLCAQALCLEEMLNIKIEKGAIYYGKTRHRMDVEFDEALKKTSIDTTRQLHELIKIGKTPAPEYSKRCDSCSLINECMPKLLSKQTSVKEYLKKMLEDDNAK